MSKPPKKPVIVERRPIKGEWWKNAYEATITPATPRPANA
jgi:hypothetical protein